MPDLLSLFERTLKALRYGIFQASDNLAAMLDGFCRIPEYVDETEHLDPDWWDQPSCGEHTGIASNRCQLPPGHAGPHDCQFVPSPAAPPAAVVAPSPKQGSDSPPRDSAILQAPSGGTQTSIPEPDLSHEEIAAVRRLLEDYGEALEAASQFFKPQK